MKIISIILLLLFHPLYAGMIPTGYSSWYYSEDPSKHVLELGAEPSNYWNGSAWTANDPSFEASAGGYRSIKNRHFVFVDTLNDIVRFAISGYNGNIHILKTRIGPLFLFNRATLDTTRLASPNLSGYVLSNDKIEIPEIYPGVTCQIWNRKAGLEHRFIFSPTADSLIDLAWRNAGADTNIFTVNTFALLVDSLNLQMRDNNGLFNFNASREIGGDIDLLSADGPRILRMPQGTVVQDSLHAPLFRCIQRFGAQARLFEGFRNSDVASWPPNGYEHNESRTWQAPGVDTYISAIFPGTSYYSNTSLFAYRDATLGVRQRSLIWFSGLADSLRNAVVIDSALLQLHYYGSALGSGTLRICRGTADSNWYNSAHATWNASYKVGNDSVKWVGGWAAHTSSFTTTSSISQYLADTSSAGYYQFSCKNMIADIKADGTDWGIWIDNGSDASTQRASFDSAENPSRAPRLYLEFRLGALRSRKLKMEE